MLFDGRARAEMLEYIQCAQSHALCIPLSLAKKPCKTKRVEKVQLSSHSIFCCVLCVRVCDFSLCRRCNVVDIIYGINRPLARFIFGVFRFRCVCVVLALCT